MGVCTWRGGYGMWVMPVQKCQNRVVCVSFVHEFYFMYIYAEPIYLSQTINQICSSTMLACVRSCLQVFRLHFIIVLFCIPVALCHLI